MALTRITKGVIKPNENYDTHNINSTGIVTAIGLDINGNGDISGNLSVGGVLTYEDVTSIDSVGIITAQKDIHVGAGISVVGVGSFGSLDISGDLDVDGHTNLDNVSVAGVTTITSSTYPLVVHADTAYQGILVNGNGAPTIGFNVNDNSTPSWKAGISGSSHLDFAISQGTGNSNRLTLKNGGGGGIVGYFTAEGFGMDEHIYHLSGNDTDTRIRFPGADTFSIDTNGVERLRINSTGITTFTGNVFLSKDLDVDGHTNLDNLSVAGVSTFSDNLHVGTGVTFETNGQGTFSGIATARIFSVGYSNGSIDHGYFQAGRIKIFDNGSHLHFRGGDHPSYAPNQRYFSSVVERTNAYSLQNTAATRYGITWNNTDGPVHLYYSKGYAPDYSIKLSTTAKGITVGSGVTIETNGQANFVGIVTALQFKGDGSQLTGIAADKIFEGNTEVETIDTGSNGIIKFTTEGTERLRIQSDGKVGVGTDSITANLHVHTTGVNSTLFMLETDMAASVQNRSFYIQSPEYANTDLPFRIRTANSMLFMTDNNEALKIHHNGYVGIHTISPQSGLHLSDGTVYGSPQNGSRKATLTISAGSESSADIQLLSANYNHIFFGDAADPNTGIIHYEHTGGNTDNMVFSTAGGERLRINNTGSIVKQIFTATNTYAANNTTQCGYQSQNLSDATNTYSALRLTAGNSSPATAQLSSIRTGAGQNDFTIQLESGNTAFETFRALSNGNFGFGIAAPTTQSGKVAHFHATSAQQRLHMTNSTTGSGATDGFEIIVNEGTETHVRNFEAGNFRISTGGNGAQYEAIRITAGGNVNVGNFDQTTYKLFVDGSFAATTKSFVIDHPTKEKHKLRYACLEGPENSVYVRGKTSDSVIELPDYWTGLVHEDSITVNVTPIGNHKVWVESINNNSVTIGSDGSEYFYTVFAERKDVDKLEVEVEE